MSFREYVSDKFTGIMIRLICAVAAALFLLATGTRPGILLILLCMLLPVSAGMLLHDFFRRRARLKELNAVFDGLDRKYLFAECVPPPKELYERRLFDLTRRAGRAMTTAVSDAETAGQEYREYIETWVHEVKTPITAARLICRRLNGDIRQRLTAELARVEAHVERALFYVRAENPDRDCVIRRTCLNDIAAKALQAHKALLIQSGVRVETEGLEQTVYTDDKWAAFIIGQLLQNAARYRGKDPVIRIAASPLGKQVRLTVADNGIGIPAHEVSRVFDKGFTGSNGRSCGGSTGIGLYLCRKLAGFLNLNLRLTSEEGKGTVVTLTFPAKESLPDEILQNRK